MELDALPTPCAVVDLPRLEANAAAMRRRAETLGVRLRPHVKTHKVPAAARLQHGGGAGPITVSTVAEAAAFATAGFDDILYAVAIAPARLAACGDVAERCHRLALLVDHPETIDAVAADGRRRGRPWPVHLEVDCGAGRAGIDPEGGDALALARRIEDTPGVELAGLLTHAGQAYRCRNRDEARTVAAHERDVMVGLARRLRSASVEVPEVSVGSTPTATAVDHLGGVTEMRPGNYLFFDAFQAAIGSCAASDIALSVLTTVVGVYPQRGAAVVDAGALALSTDPGPVHVDPACGFGLVCTPDGTPRTDLRVAALSQEHGVLRGAVAGLRPGDRLRLLPNHSCLAAACHAAYHVAWGLEVVECWRPARGW